MLTIDHVGCGSRVEENRAGLLTSSADPSPPCHEAVIVGIVVWLLGPLISGFHDMKGHVLLFFVVALFESAVRHVVSSNPAIATGSSRALEGSMDWARAADAKRIETLS